MNPTETHSDASFAIASAAPAPASAWNPRYVAFCRVHGHTPDEQRVHDVERWPGGKMVGFILWISKQWQAWRIEANAKDGGKRGPHDTRLPEDHAAFDARLAALGPCACCAACEAS